MKTNNAEVNEQTVKGLEERLREILSVCPCVSQRQTQTEGRGGGGSRRQTVQKESNAVSG